MENDKKYIKVDAVKYRKALHDITRLKTIVDELSTAFCTRLENIRIELLGSIKNGE